MSLRVRVRTSARPSPRRARAAALAVVVASCLAAPASASASSAELTGTEVFFSGDAVEANSVEVVRDGTLFRIRDVVALRGGAGCDQVSLTEVTCPEQGVVSLRADGGPGDDTIDVALAGAPALVSGGDGIDRLLGGEADDTLLGGAGDDALVGGAGADSLTGDAGSDALEGGDGDDTLVGGADDDSLTGGAGSDWLIGGDGADDLRALDDAVDDVSCGEGIDSVVADADDRIDADCEILDLRTRAPVPDPVDPTDPPAPVDPPAATDPTAPPAATAPADPPAPAPALAAEAPVFASAGEVIAASARATPKPRLQMLTPFPTVRIRGTVGRRGANIELLSVQAPRGVTVSVRCSGRRCPAPARGSRATNPIATVFTRSARTVSFRRLQTVLPAGTTLEVRVTRPDRIGKYTRFRIRAGKPPARRDSCVEPGRLAPIACPSD